MFKSLSRAAAKSAAAKLRSWHGLPTYPAWAGRATICENCPIRRVYAGVSYCGSPYLQQPIRQPIEGCGCPTREKAKDPAEHCPLTRSNRPASQSPGKCDCKWCQAKTAQS
jgi:hypothetical protein